MKVVLPTSAALTWPSVKSASGLSEASSISRTETLGGSGPGKRFQKLS